MYFPFLELRKWGKKAAENRRRNCAVLPKTLFFTMHAHPLTYSASGLTKPSQIKTQCTTTGFGGQHCVYASGWQGDFSIM